MERTPAESARIDKWLWAARFFKARGAATEAVAGGHVVVNGARVKPSKDIRPGDTVEVRLGARRWTVLVLAIAERRGPAAAAAALYRETAESVARREQQSLERRLAWPPGASPGARPTKRDRRRLDALREARRRRGERG